LGLPLRGQEGRGAPQAELKQSSAVNHQILTFRKDTVFSNAMLADAASALTRTLMGLGQFVSMARISGLAAAGHKLPCPLVPGEIIR